MARATLLESNPDFALILPYACESVGIHVTVVGTPEAVERATLRSGLDDLVIVDLSLNRSADQDRCVAVARHTYLDLLVIYKPDAPDHAAFVGRMEREAHGDLMWLPATVSVVELLDFLRVLRRRIMARHLRAKPFSPRQTEVLALLMRGRTQEEIAAVLGIGKGAVSRHVERIEEKLDVTSTEEIKDIYRWLPDEGEGDSPSPSRQGLGDRGRVHRPQHVAGQPARDGQWRHRASRAGFGCDYQ